MTRTPARKVADGVSVVVAALISLMAVAGGAALALPLVLGATGHGVTAVTSGSMTPSMEIGTSILLDTRIDRAALKRGDVITFRVPGGTTTHRIVDVNGDGAPTTYAVRGDHNATNDAAPVSAGAIVGVVVKNLDYAVTAPGGREVHLGRALTWARTSAGVRILLGPLLACFILIQLSELLSITAPPTRRGALETAATMAGAVLMFMVLAGPATLTFHLDGGDAPHPATITAGLARVIAAETGSSLPADATLAQLQAVVGPTWADNAWGDVITVTDSPGLTEGA